MIIDIILLLYDWDIGGLGGSEFWGGGREGMKSGGQMNLDIIVQSVALLLLIRGLTASLRRDYAFL
jgi:hypothetical protein